MKFQKKTGSLIVDKCSKQQAAFSQKKLYEVVIHLMTCISGNLNCSLVFPPSWQSKKE
ncbi:hypothetical protein RLOC_00002169 [Lonchura striata]|uniref:Uncharacterized protein n=1 Tax=Lonchura striata TaxID=40157 RepID=A0A218VFX9_9PASE|nr:hypothetical protein RLOC_00002169 [Lonchura striata domestica]